LVHMSDDTYSTIVMGTGTSIAQLVGNIYDNKNIVYDNLNAYKGISISKNMLKAEISEILRANHIDFIEHHIVKIGGG